MSWGPPPPGWKEEWPPADAPASGPPPWHAPWKPPPWSRRDWFGCLAGWASLFWLVPLVAAWLVPWLRGRDLDDPAVLAPVAAATASCVVCWAGTLFLLKAFLGPDR